MINKLEIYEGNDLGFTYTKDKTKFRLWAPKASKVELCLYDTGDGDTLKEKIEMEKSSGGTWIYECDGDLNGIYYVYDVCNDGTSKQTLDPYAKAVGVNGVRSMVVDLESTNPDGFDKDKGPVYENKTDLIVTEISVADTTADESCHAKNKGKFLGLIERGLKTDKGYATGFDHILEMGVTHVQLMPMFDFASIDESDLSREQYNWGYDPLNYNVPEGSYSLDPFHGEVRVKELKEVVKAFHDEGIGVIMDVVYNHTFDIDGSCFQKTVPDYFYRKNGEEYSDASACGNEIASEQYMVRKYIIDSLCYWVKEYHIDGFRFDLMGVLDIETLNQARKKLVEINPDIILYGEGWTGGDSTLPDDERALKVNVSKLDGYGVFSDDIRDGIRGHVFYLEQKGFVNGGKGMENDIRFSVAGAMEHPQVDYDKYEYTPEGAWAAEPEDVINYASCHDNLTLWDKLIYACEDSSKEELVKMNLLSAAIVFTSQGIPFFLQGEEFARTKPIKGSDEKAENSYNLPLYTNSLKYDRIDEFSDMYEYYKGLISFRKAHADLKLKTAEEVRKKIKFIDELPENVVAFLINGNEENIFVVYNANKDIVDIKCDELCNDKDWLVYVDNNKAGNDVLAKFKNQTQVQGISCLVAIQKA
ncbi:MAG: type I pullulanase [Agathobacter sp.]|nr:type I pullulanase [Agathobacter sp.]